ncbi:MAG: sensor histidine kinase [Sphingomonadaceae bacterium]
MIEHDASDADQSRADDNPDALTGVDDSLFRRFAEHMPILCWMATADGSIFWYNRRWHEYCGSTPAEMAGWGWQSVHDPDVLPAVLERWTGCIAAGAPFDMTFPLRGADGVFRPFLTRIEPIRDAAGHLKWWFGVNVDVSAQIAAETELTAVNLKKHAISAEREAILGQLGEGVIVTDPEGRITFVNEAAVRLHGVKHLDVGPEDYTAAYSLWTEDGEPHPPETLPLTRAVRNEEVVVDARWRIRRADGSDVMALGNAKPIYARDQSLIGAVLTIRDDTLRHATEQAMAQAIEVKEVMLQEVNHRVKNNLQLVTSLLSLQAERTKSAEVAASLAEARTRIGVVAGMHQRLYNTMQHDRVNLSEYLEELASDSITALDTKRRILFSFSADRALWVPLEHAVSLALVVNELLTNAVKYAFDEHEAGNVSIDLAHVGDDVCITVSDDGKGLPPEFELTASKGLGMLIVTALVGQVHGLLTIVEQNRGTGFAIAIPVTRLAESMSSPT